MFKKVLCFLTLFATIQVSLFAESFEGALTGKITGKIKGDIEVNGTVSGKWYATIDEKGAISGYANGTFGLYSGEGFSGSFSVAYDPETKSLKGTWWSPGFSKNGTLILSYSSIEQGFSGDINGTIPTEAGGLPFKGHLTLELKGFPSELGGVIETKSFEVTIGWRWGSCEGKALKSHGSELSGTWKVSVLDDGSITGDAEGMFKGVASLEMGLDDLMSCSGGSLPFTGGLPIAFPSITLEFPFFGKWSGTLMGSIEKGFYFGGSWVESADSDVFSAFGEGLEGVGIEEFIPEDELEEMNFGGSVKLDIDTSAPGFPLPITGSVKGGGIAKVKIRKLLEAKGICEELTSYFSPYAQMPGVPECLKENVCLCVPEEVEVEWWVDNVTLEGYIKTSE